MPTVVFERTRFSVEAPDGARVVDLSDAHFMAAVPYACRHANCGSCRVRVESGQHLCAPPDEPEAELLAFLKEAPDVRLACQLEILAGEGTVRLRVLR